jgi:hypothetical protein
MNKAKGVFGIIVLALAVPAIIIITVLTYTLWNKPK